jgi:Holliday junction resolvase RusA-like endonuclease
MIRTLLSAYLPLPPSVNDLHDVAISSRSRKPYKYLKQSVRAWKQEAIILLQANAWHDVPAIQAARQNTSVWLALAMCAWMTRRGIADRDTDNFPKVVADTVFNLYLAIDDVRIADISLQKRLTPAGSSPMLWIAVLEKSCLEEVLEIDVSAPPPPACHAS